MLFYTTPPYPVLCCGVLSCHIPSSIIIFNTSLILIITGTHTIKYIDDETHDQCLLDDSHEWNWLDEDAQEILIRKKVSNIVKQCSKPHYTTPYYTTAHYTTLHYTTLRYTILHYTILYYTTLHYATLHYTQYSTLHYTTLHYTTLHYTTLNYTTLHYTTPHYTTLHYTTLHYTTAH